MKFNFYLSTIKAFSFLSVVFFICYVNSVLAQEKSEIDSLNMALEQITRHASDQTDYKSLTACLLQLGSANIYAGNYDSALVSYQKSLEICNQQKDKNGAGESNLGIGDVFLRRNNDFEAVKYYNIALTLFENMHNDLGVGKVKMKLGTAYFNIYSVDSALAMQQRALEIFQRLGDKKLLARIRTDIGKNYTYKNEFQKAIVEYIISIKLCEETGDQKQAVICYDRLGMVQHDLHNDKAAMENYQKALRLATAIDYKLRIASANNNIGQLLCDQKKYNEGIKYILKALNVFMDIDKGMVEATAKVLANDYIEMGDSANALKYFLLHKHVKDSLVEIQKLNQIRELQTKYETEKKDKEIILLNTEKQLEQANSEKQKAQKIYLLLLFVLAALIASILFYRFKTKTKQKQEAERARISRDLHDDVGATLGSISIYSEVAKNKSSANSDMSEVLTKIGDSSREMLEKMNDIVWAVNPTNDSAEQLLQRMKNFAAIILTPRNIGFEFVQVAGKVDELTLGMEHRKNIFLIYKEGLHNIVKYAEAKNVWIEFALKGNHLHFKIKDDGKGFHPGNESVYNGNGMRNMRERAEKIGAVFSVLSELDKGTQLDLKVPL